MTAISFEQTVDTVPTFTFNVCGNPKLVFDDALVNINFTTPTVESAVAVICRALNTDAVFYDAFHASILSAIREAPSVCNECELATRILDRIVGRD